MEAFENRFLRRLLDRLNKEIDLRVGHLVEGKGVNDLADYKAKVEYIRALKFVGEVLCMDVGKEIMRESEKRNAGT